MYIDMGRKAGKLEGKKEGKTQKLKEIVLNMIKENLSNEIIMKVTGISKKEIEELKHMK